MYLFSLVATPGLPICITSISPLGMAKRQMMGMYRILSSSIHHLLMSIHKSTKSQHFSLGRP